jgi:hypothetical protein
MNLFIYVDDFNKSSHHCVNQQVFKQNKNYFREIKKQKQSSARQNFGWFKIDRTL